MKKVLALILALTLSLTVLSACGGALEDPPPLPPPRVRDPSASINNPPPAPPPSTPEPAPGTSNPVDDDTTIPGNGGTFHITETTEFAFIPAQSGVWEFFTSDNGNSDPYLELYGSNFDGEYGDLIWEDDDSAGDLNAIITRVLSAGSEYFIRARTWSSRDTDTFTLTVRQINPEAIPGNGGSVQVDGETYFVFIPGTSGMWEFLTSDNGDSDPKLHIYDIDGVELYDDDDSGGDSNARIRARLDSGTTYYVRATFFWDFTGRYTLSVTLQ